MQPENLKLGGGLTQTVLHPLVLFALIVAALLILFLPKKNAIVAVLVMAFLVPLGQQFVIGGAHVLCATLTGALSYNLKVGRAGLGEVGGRPRGGQGEAWAGQDKAGPGLGGPRGWVGAL